MKTLLTIFTLVFTLMFSSTSFAEDLYKDGEFEATLTYVSGVWNLYKVNLSTIPDLNWISTIACVELLLMDDVIIEVYKSSSMNRVVGGFFYVIDEDESRDEWDDCQITGFHKYRPETD